MLGLVLFPLAIVAAIAAALTTMALAYLEPSLKPMLLFPLAFAAYLALAWAILLAWLG
jgi:hypothetical protein